MDVVRLDEVNVAPAAARSAAAVLRAGGVVLYPTDTLYGLGVDALSDEAVEKVYAIKGRDEGKPIHAIVADLGMAARYGEIDDRVRILAEKFPKGKITFLVKKRADVNSGIARNIETFGFRIPDSELCIALARAFAGPITATSANVSGKPTLNNAVRIIEQLGDRANDIDLVIDGGELAVILPSTVVDLSSHAPKVLRGGAVDSSDVWGALARL